MTDTTTNGQTLHQAALQAGFMETIPIIPPDAVLHEHSRVDPKARGKVPGDYYGGAWDGRGNWPSYQMTMDAAIRWDSLGANVGLKMGVAWVALDVDVSDDMLAHEMRQWIEQYAATSGIKWPIRVGKAPKFMLLFRVQAPILTRQYGLRIEGGDKQLIEVRGQSAKGTPTQCVIFGRHPDGMNYEWDVPVTAAMFPWVSQEQMDYMVECLLRIGENRGYTRGRPTRTGAADGTSALGAEAFDMDLVAPVVDLIGNDDLEYDDWVRVGYAIKACMGDAGWSTWATWSAKARKDDPRMTKRTWDTLKPDGSTGFGTLVYLARQDCGGVLPSNIASKVRFGVASKGAVAAGMPETVNVPLAPPEEQIDQPWEDYAVKQDGTIIPNFANVFAMICNQDEWKHCFAFDAFAGRPVLIHPMPDHWNKVVPRYLTDEDDMYVHKWFQTYVFSKIGKQDVRDAVHLNMHRNTFEPVQNYLRDLTWDGTPRIDSWLFRYAGVIAQHFDPVTISYIGVVGRKWLISAIARAMMPGCQVDHALIMEGSQGSGKSSVLRALCPDPEWFGDSLPDFHKTQEAAEYMQGKWIIEMAELTQVWGSSIEDMRRFLTRRVEDYVPKYVRRTTRFPRRCIFAGSTNRDDYLRDVEGERRFWIVQCHGMLDVNGIAADRDQLWAEAYAAFQAGEAWHLEPGMEHVAREIQKSRVPVDPWAEELMPFVGPLQEVSVKQCLIHLGIYSAEKREIKSENRIKRCLKSLGFRNAGRFTAGPQMGVQRWAR